MGWITALMLSGAAAAGPAIPAADRWNVAVDLGKCTLERRYTQPTVAALTLYTQPGTDGYVLEVATATAIPRSPGYAMTAAVKVDGKIRHKGPILVDHGNAPYQQGSNVTLDRTEVDAIGQGSTLTLVIGKYEVSVPVPDAAKAIAALHQCEAEQLTEWGADPAQFAPGGTLPKAGDRYQLVPQRVMRTVHYSGEPIEPLHYLVLSETGTVERCAAVYGVTGSDVEAIVCKFMMGRNVGTPARDPSGKPVRGVISFTPAILETVTIVTSETRP